eukprot:1183509-Rhodomonas_salina.1
MVASTLRFRRSISLGRISLAARIESSSCGRERARQRKRRVCERREWEGEREGERERVGEKGGKRRVVPQGKEEAEGERGRQCAETSICRAGALHASSIGFAILENKCRARHPEIGTGAELSGRWLRVWRAT